MKCPRCGSNDIKCWNSRSIDNYRCRTYKCNACSTNFRTKEVVVEIKNEGDYHYTSTVPDTIDPKVMFVSIKQPFSELLGVMRTYDKLLE